MDNSFKAQIACLREIEHEMEHIAQRIWDEQQVHLTPATMYGRLQGTLVYYHRTMKNALDAIERIQPVEPEPQNYEFKFDVEMTVYGRVTGYEPADPGNPWGDHPEEPSPEYIEYDLWLADGTRIYNDAHGLDSGTMDRLVLEWHRGWS